MSEQMNPDMQLKVRYEMVKVYDWFEIQEAICKEMGIEEHQFRRYHQVVGGGWKDLWHVARDVFVPETMANDTIVKMCAIDDLTDVEKWLKDGTWALPMLKAYNKIMNEIDPEQNGVEVRFSW